MRFIGSLYGASLYGAAALILGLTGIAAGQDQSFESLAEDAIRRAGEPVGVLPQRLVPPAGASAAQEPAAATDADPAPAPEAEGANDAAGAEVAGGERSMESLSVEEVNAATIAGGTGTGKGASPLVLKLQVLLDRNNASPGVIDGINGGNVSKAISAMESTLGLPVDGEIDPEVWAALGGDSARPVLVDYEITAEDVAGPFVPEIPTDYALLAKLESVAYTGPAEMFSERFHMDIDLLKALNPGKDFSRPGETIVVADVKSTPIPGKVARIEADKQSRQLRAYDEKDWLVVAYPATIGSEDNPSPSGEHKVNGVAANPVYYYNPKNFQQGDNTEKLEIPPGPNNPVGSMWIDLSEPTYGIHGTPEPSRIDKTGSHGCIRLTNWDAEELAKLVKPGIVVAFVE